MVLTSQGLQCTPNPVFQWSEVALPGWLHSSVGTTIAYKPFCLHAVVMAMFASLIAPFGGFFASGLKRAFQIKVSVCVSPHVASS